MTGNIFKPSAKRVKEKKMDFSAKKIIKNILNNRGPKVEPCGTPDSAGKGMYDFYEVPKTENIKDN
jgi:hypothetical protein